MIAVVVWPQRCGLLPDSGLPGHDVLLHPEAGRTSGLQLQAVDHPLLGADLPVYLGRSAPPALHRVARLGLDAGHGVLDHPVDAVWGGMINGLMTLQGAWDKLRTDPIIRMMVISVGFYGMSTFEGPMMSIKAVNSLSHYTDWTIGHVHSGALGWNGMITFGALYFLVPVLWKRERLYSMPADGQLALLARDHWHRALRRVDVGHRHHGRPDVARSGCQRLPGELVRRHRQRQVPDVCGAWSGWGSVPRWLLHHVLEPVDDCAASPSGQRGQPDRRNPKLNKEGRSNGFSHKHKVLETNATLLLIFSFLV